MIVSDDPVTRNRSRLVYDGDHLHVRNNQEVSEIVEFNRAEFNSIDGGVAADGERTGRIPMVIVYDLMRKGIWEDDDALLQWLELPENAAWKVHPGRFA
jgi:hypothetical protein